MAGMFGRSSRAAIPGLPELSFADRAMIFGGALLNPALGQMIKDRKTIIPAQRNYMAELAERVRGTPERQVEMPVGNAEGQDISAAFSPQMTTQPGRAPLSIGDKDLPALALRAQQLGIPLDGLLEVLKAQQPSIKIGPDGRPYNERDPSVLGQRFANRSAVNDTIVDMNDPNNTNRVVPKAPVAGAMPVYDNLGRVTDWTLPNGARQVIGEASQADTTGRTFGTVFNRPNGDGTTSPTLGRDMFGGGGGVAAPGAGGPGRTQAPDDAAYAGDVAKASAAQYTGIQSAGQKAATNIANFTRMNQLLDGLNTGSMAPTGLAMQKALASVGIQGNPAWGRVEAADALSKKLALDAMGGSLGAGFSNADRGFVEAMNPSIMNTPQGRKRMIEFGIARAKREQLVAEKARQWNQRAGRLDKPDRNGKTFFDYLDAYANANPLVKQ